MSAISAVNAIPVEGRFIGHPRRRLFTVLRRPSRAPRAAVLLCPPFFHEQFLSYRLLSLVCTRLAERGIASLRFDYFGTGDSGGVDEDFTPDGAIADTRAALEVLGERVPAVPTIVSGARAGALPAAMIAAERALPLWLWQPVVDGGVWLRELEAMDARERGSLERYPFLNGRVRPAEPDRLVASYCPPSLRAWLERSRVEDIAASAGITIDVVDGEDEAPLACARNTLRIPRAAAAWYAKIDIRVAVLTREIARCVDALGDLADRSAS